MATAKKPTPTQKKARAALAKFKAKKLPMDSYYMNLTQQQKMDVEEIRKDAGYYSAAAKTNFKSQARLFWEYVKRNA